MDLSRTDASGSFVSYLPRLPLRNKEEVLSPEDLVADLQSAGFRGLTDKSLWTAAADVENDYVALGDSNIQIVSDRKIGLDWYVVGYVTDGYSWDQAKSIIQKLNSRLPLGLSGWRLPTTLELASILEPEERAHIYNIETNEIYDRYCIDPLLLPNTAPRFNYSAEYWSSDLRSENWPWILDSIGCSFRKWRRNYAAQILAVRSHDDG